jgi:hypothetical protein
MRINTRLGGRNIYWNDADGHVWEILTISEFSAKARCAERDAPAPDQGLGSAGDGAAGVTDTPFTREQQEFLRGLLSEVVKEVNKANKHGC